MTVNSRLARQQLSILFQDVDASVTMQSTIEASEEDVIISKRPVSENEMIQFASSHDGKIYKLNLYTGLTPSRYILNI